METGQRDVTVGVALEDHGELDQSPAPLAVPDGCEDLRQHSAEYPKVELEQAASGSVRYRYRYRYILFFQLAHIQYVTMQEN